MGHGSARAGDEQALRVHAVWGAGEQGHLVLAGRDLEVVEMVGIHHFDAGDLVGEGFADHFDVEEVADLALAQAEFVEHHPVGETGVRGDDGVRVLAAHGQGGAVHVARAVRERGLAGAVAYGQVDAEPWIGDGGHDAVGRQIELGLVVLVRVRYGLAAVAGEGIHGLAHGGLAADEESFVVVAGAAELVLALLPCERFGFAVVRLDDGVGLIAVADHEDEWQRAEDGAERKKHKASDGTGVECAPAFRCLVLHAHGITVLRLLYLRSSAAARIGMTPRGRLQPLYAAFARARRADAAGFTIAQARFLEERRSRNAPPPHSTAMAA